MHGKAAALLRRRKPNNPPTVTTAPARRIVWIQPARSFATTNTQRPTGASSSCSMVRVSHSCTAMRPEDMMPASVIIKTTIGINSNCPSVKSVAC